MYGFILGVVGGSISALILAMVFLSFQGDIAYFLGFEPGADVSFVSDVFLPLVSTLAGAAAGSIVAYRLQGLTAERALISSDVQTINATILTLEAQISELANLKRTMIMPFKSSPVRFLEMPIVMGASARGEYPAELSLVLIRYKRGELIMKLRVTERLYANVQALVSDLVKYRAQYLDKLRAAGIGQFDISSLRQKVNCAGPEVVGQLYVVAEGLIVQLDSAMADARKCLESLSLMFGEVFPRNKYRSLKTEILAEAQELFEVCDPPFFSDVKELLSYVDYRRVWHDPVDGDLYSIDRLARKNWKVTAYQKY